MLSHWIGIQYKFFSPVTDFPVLPEASFGHRILPLPASVCVCVSVFFFFFFFFFGGGGGGGAIDLDLQG